MVTQVADCGVRSRYGIDPSLLLSHCCLLLAMDRRQDIGRSYLLLSKEWSARPVNQQKVAALLSLLKIALTEITFLPTDDEGGVDAATMKKDLLTGRDVLEIGALFSVLTKDIPAFERYLSQLKCYYFDYEKDLPESAFKYQILGLNLIRLLSQNRVAEFHTELELLPPHEIRQNVYISHPVSLEQWLMEGRYNKLFMSKDNVPAESYNFFIDLLLDTIRAEIAACIEAAFEQISLQEAARILFLKDVKQVQPFARQLQKNWQIRENRLLFGKKESDKVVEQIPSQQLMAQAIGYARELETIV